MAKISVERTIGETKRAVLAGLNRFNVEYLPKHVDTMSFQAPGFYRSCGYEQFGAIDGYPGGVTRHWFTKAL